MKKLHELFRRKPVDGLFGIEIECEGQRLPDYIDNQWRIVDDGSLRGRFPDQRAEYVLQKPLPMDKAITAVNNLRNRVDANNAKLDFSFRTSVHVHMNVGDITFDQYLNIIYTYLLLENALVRYCGEERVGNRFCLRYQDAEQLGEFLQVMFAEGLPFLQKANMEAHKYASINIAATPAYCSLEFRAMRGNMEVDYISTWLRALNNIKQYAVGMDSPQAIHDAFVKMHPSEFMQMVLKEEYRFFAYEQEVDDMRLAFSVTIDLPYAYSSAEKRLAKAKQAIENRKLEIQKMYERERERLDLRMKQDIDQLPIDEMAEFIDNFEEEEGVRDIPMPARLRANLDQIREGMGVARDFALPRNWGVNQLVGNGVAR